MKTNESLAAIAIAALRGPHENGYGGWRQNMPRCKFWMGWIPFSGFPYPTIVSAVDAVNFSGR